MFIVQIANSFSSRHRSTRDRERNMTRDTLAAAQSHPLLSLPPNGPVDLNSQLNWQPTAKLLLHQLTNFQNSLIFIYSKIHYIISVMSSHKVTATSHHDQHTCLQLSPCSHFTSIKLMIRREYIYTFGLPVLRWRVSSIICSLVHSLDLSNLTYISTQTN